MPEQQGDKSQEPTPHRRQKAREAGQMAKSQDLGSAVILVGGLLALLLLGQRLVDFLARYGQNQLGGQAWLTADTAFATAVWNGTLLELARHLLPILGVLLVVAVAVNVLQVGFLFLPSKLGFDFARVDPIKGAQRLFTTTNAMRLAFGIFKILVIAAVALVSLYSERETILGLAALSLPGIAVYLVQILLWTSMKIGIALLLLAILDYGFQWWKHEQDLRMTPQEVREEMKHLEGDPQVAARRRVVQRQLVLNRVSESVPKADVVVTNPTQLAVAIQYDPKTTAVPIVVAKGAGVIAQRIRRLALEHDIPIVERKELAQALYREVEVNKPVPQDKYAAVAEVLAYVYHLKGEPVPGPPSQAA
jgi:flagellar biosynthetic protein FlhB